MVRWRERETEMKRETCVDVEGEAAEPSALVLFVSHARAQSKVMDQAVLS